MKMSEKAKWFFRDFKTQAGISIQLLIRDKITVFVFLFSCICFGYLCSTLNFSANTRSKIPIGLVNEDVTEEKNESVLSKELVEKVVQCDLFYVVLEDKNELMRQMERGDINCIFEITKGYEKKIQAGQSDKLITLYKNKGNENATLLADVFAGEMMEQVTLEKGYDAYRKLNFEGYQEMSRTEYIEFYNKLKEDDDFAFSFSVKMNEHKNNGIKFDNLNNALLYREIIAGIFAMLLSFVVLFSFTYVCMEKEQGILKRRKMTAMSSTASALGQYCSIVITATLLCVIFIIGICRYADCFEAALDLFYLSLLFIFIISIIFLLLAKLLKGVIVYQFVGAILILALGLVGFLSILDGALINELPDILQYTPNVWFIKKFADILIHV